VEKVNTEIPVLVVAFIRPKETLQLLSKLVQLGVSNIYISIDGPRNDIDSSLQQLMTAQIEKYLSTEKIEWHIQHERQNLGVRKGVLNGLDWFFSEEKLGIILEDDLSIESDFLTYCSYYLGEIDRFQEIWMISGMQLLDEYSSSPTHILSNYPMIWGWATTANKWKEMRKSVVSQKPLSPKSFGFQRSYFWNRGFSKVNSGELDTWDLPLALSFLYNRRFCLISNQNLVKNIGFGPEASHTSNAKFPLNHPIGSLDFKAMSKLEEIVYSKEYDFNLERKVFKFKLRHFLFGVVQSMILKFKTLLNEN